MRRRIFPSRRVRGGVTLLELLLALALSVVVLTAIGMAINLHFKMLDARRTNIEEIQAIRVIAMRMTNDIRANVQQYKPDTSGLETTFQNAMQAATSQASAAAAGAATIIGGSGASGGKSGGGGQGTGGGTQTGGGGQGTGGGNQNQGGQSQGAGGGGQGTGGGGQSGGGQGGQAAGGAQASGGQAGGTAAAGGSGASGTSGSQSGSSAEASTTATAGPAVKLVGSAMELRFDISRLPRIDQYQGIMSKGELSAVDLPSDVKTIVYFLRSDTSAATYASNPSALGGEPSLDGYGRGLMRAELDRAVSSYAETGGGTDSVYASAQLLSEEIVWLGFQYFDGVDWLEEWDSSSQGLPRAIRIGLSVKPTYGMSEQELSDAAAGKAPVETELYFTVSLPTTPLVIPAAEAETTDAASGSTSTSSSGSTSTSGTASGTATQGATP